MNNFEKLCKIVGANPEIVRGELKDEAACKKFPVVTKLLKISQHMEPRSEEFLEGLLSLMNLKAGYKSSLKCPYGMGSVQADAYYSGTDYGHMIWEELHKEDEVTA